MEIALALRNILVAGGRTKRVMQNLLTISENEFECTFLMEGRSLNSGARIIREDEARIYCKFEGSESHLAEEDTVGKPLEEYNSTVNIASRGAELS